MYEDSWYNFVPEITSKKGPTNSQSHGHRRKESLLLQPIGTGTVADIVVPMPNVYEDIENTNTPPDAVVIRRAGSCSDLQRLASARPSKDERLQRKKTNRWNRVWEALDLSDSGVELERAGGLEGNKLESYDEQLLDASQGEYLLYRDQLTLTERHLDGLIDDANATLKLLTSLSHSFQSVEAQTSTFQSQCEDLLKEQRRLEALADDVGTDLHYYAYLDNATRRLNAPGASRLVDDDSFGQMIENIDACIVFMEKHETYRDRDTYLARYNALLTKALHLLEHGYKTRLESVSPDISRQIAATKSDSARHALAYGRFQEMMLDSYGLIPNVRQVVRRVYDFYGKPVDSCTNFETYANTAKNIFYTHLTTRDRDLKLMIQADIQEFQKEVKSLSAETASRNFIKLCFERMYNEEGLFLKLFDVEPMWNTAPDSVFQSIKTINTSINHPGNMTPMVTNLQPVLQAASLQITCNVVGWLANEYFGTEFDEVESPYFSKSKQYTSQLLVHHLWPLTDAAFEVEVTKSITKAAAPDTLLKIGPVVGGVASSNAHPLVKQAIKLLAMYEHCMPKERAAKNNAVVFKIVRETIQVLQRAEARIKYVKSGPDADLFMVKNLLIVKNELVSLEIGDIRNQTASMQHFSHIWDTLSPQNWVGFISNIIGGSLWSRGTPSVTAKTLTVEDMNEQLDELLRHSIYAFTQRWGTLMTDSRNRKTGVKPIAKVETELETILQTAFSNQPEVVGKLKEAIEQHAQAQSEAKDSKQGIRRY
ncbi:Sec34-like family-domain-containing protein [Dactylonectria estremocensis]|uniref:Conserved oligomeric Golgi complex subunit 3 n=1 Tax=Dactylonectria estremocensis TaxID=1079267 RepID=A0A9P9F7U9_9HYPO|nr:Sec34-like family-domain-containing protein [Dactylonectria estremocensis]